MEPGTHAPDLRARDTGAPTPAACRASLARLMHAPGPRQSAPAAYPWSRLQTPCRNGRVALGRPTQPRTPPGTGCCISSTAGHGGGNDPLTSAQAGIGQAGIGQAGTRPGRHAALPGTPPSEACRLASHDTLLPAFLLLPPSQPRPRPHALGTEIAGNYLTVSPRTAHRSPASIGIRSRARERLRAKSPAHLPPHPLLPRLHLHRDPAHDRPRPPTEFASCNFRSQPLARMPLNLARCLRRSAVPVLVGSNQKESQAQFELRGILPHNITTAVTVHARAGSFVFCSRRLAK